MRTIVEVVTVRDKYLVKVTQKFLFGKEVFFVAKDFQNWSSTFAEKNCIFDNKQEADYVAGITRVMV